MADENPGRAFLEHLERYLARRDGVDKLLKIARYAAKIALAAPPSAVPLPDGARERLRLFDASVGTSRKAFRLGKFVQDVNALAAASRASPTDRQRRILEIIAYGGEGIYFFVEQFVWLAKTGLIDKRHAKRLQKISAWSEFVGYFGSVLLKYKDILALIEKEECLIEDSRKKHDDNDHGSGDAAALSDEIRSQIQAIRTKRFLKSLSLVQDFADSLLALSDIRDGRGRLSSPFLLAFAGLVSALISTYKNWTSC